MAELPLVTLSDATIHALMLTTKVQEQFPCMAMAVQRLRGSAKAKCNKCGSGATPSSGTPDYNALKQCIISSNTAAKLWLKDHLHAGKIRFKYVNSVNKQIMATF